MSVTAGRPQAVRRADALDGLRGFAAAAVVFAHFVVFMGLLPFTPLGAIGVLVFFALSGYLIAVKCWAGPSNLRAYRSFLKRRVERLAPACLALVVIGGLALATIGGVPVSSVARDVVVVLSQSTAFASAWADTVHPAFLPTWSLSVEWVYYLAFPLILSGLRRAGLGTGACSKLLWALASVLYGLGLFLPARLFYLLPIANLGVLFAGAALATWHLQQPERRRTADNGRTAMSLLLLSILVFLPGYTLSSAWKYCILPATTVSALVVIHGAWSGNRVSRLLAAPPLREVGLRSYSLYLWHVPAMWITWISLPALAPQLRAILALPGIAVATILSFRHLEAPVLNRGHLPLRQGAPGTRRRRIPMRVHR